MKIPYKIRIEVNNEKCIIKIQFNRRNNANCFFNIVFLYDAVYTGYAFDSNVDEIQLCKALQSTAKELFRLNNLTMVLVGNKRKMQQRKVNSLLKKYLYNI